MPKQVFREVKRTINGEERVFACEALSVSARRAIVKYVFKNPLRAGGNTFSRGGYTEGFFWRARHYNLYHICAPDGQPVADRFDVIDRVRIRPDGVQFDDLLLDVWIYPDGRIVVEDEDEVEEAIKAGFVSPARQKLIASTRRLIVTRGPALVASALRDLAAVR